MKKFLSKYDTLIFDMDGVITSEQGYWDGAALTVWEYLNDDLDTVWCMENFRDIRNRVFCGDKLISVLKSKGINSNWDLGYMTVCLCMISSAKDNFECALKIAEALPDNIGNEYDNIARLCSEKTGVEFDFVKRNGTMWKKMHDIFQEWFLGDELFFAQYGYMPKKGRKSGLVYKEQPIMDISYIKETLKTLSDSKRLCIGTGRPKTEIITPLEQWDCLKYFDKYGIVTYDDVERVQRITGNNALAKPHPYMFQKALYSREYDDIKILNGDFDKSKTKRALIIGDAGADILAAQAMDADFCAVLTGIDGQNGRKYFEDMKATYILNDVKELI